MFVTILSLAAAGYLFVTVPKGFFPIEDTGVIIASTEAAQDISVASMSDHTLAVANAIKADPNVADVTAFVGIGQGNASLNNGRIFVQLKPRSERELSATQVLEGFDAARQHPQLMHIATDG